MERRRKKRNSNANSCLPYEAGRSLDILSQIPAGKSIKEMIDFKLKEYSTNRLIWIFIAAYSFLFCYISYLKLSSFSYGDFDLAINEQILWNLGHGPMYNSVLGIHFLGNHMHLVLFLLAPIYKLFPHALTLLWLQTFALSLAAFPLYLLAKRILSPGWAIFISFIYLFYPPLAYINLFEFHPVIFSIPFLLWMLYFFFSERFLPFVCFMVLAFLCQENIPLGVVALGIYACIIRRSKKWILTPLIAGLLYFLLAVKVLLPFFNKKTLQFLLLYRNFGNSYTEVLVNIISHPFSTLRFMFMPHKLHYLSQVFLPLSFMPFFSPGPLIMAAPFFLQHLLSVRPTEVTIFYHYTAELIPFIFTAFIFGIKRIVSFKPDKRLHWIAGGCLSVSILLSGVLLGPYFTLPKAMELKWSKDGKDRVKEMFLAKVPADASVVTTFEFLPFLSHRKGLYSFHHVYHGFYTMSSRPYELPSDVEYALLDFSDKLTFTLNGFYTPGGDENIRRFLGSGNWGVVDAMDSIVLFRRNQRSDISLYEVMDSAPKPEHKAGYIIQNTLELLGYDISRQEEKTRVVFYWHCLNNTNQDISTFFHLVDKNGGVIYEAIIPICYRIYPTTAWKPGEYIKETKFLPYAAEARVLNAAWKLGFYNFLTGEGYPVTDNDVFGRIELDSR